jgi:hypothetical protein
MSERIKLGDVYGGPHATSDELALYVIDALDGARKGAVETHLMVCEGCADRLAREASVEAALEEVARLAEERACAPLRAAVIPLAVSVASSHGGDARPSAAAVVPAPILPLPPKPSARRHVLERNRWAGGVVGALAAAAALVLAFASATPARAETVEMSRRPSLHDAADMSGAFGGEAMNVDALDGG